MTELKGSSYEVEALLQSCSSGNQQREAGRGCVLYRHTVRCSVEEPSQPLSSDRDQMEATGFNEKSFS